MTKHQARRVWIESAATREEATFSTIQELIAVPFIQDWHQRDDFLSFSTIQYPEENYWGLLLTHKTGGGTTTRQIAYISDGNNLDFSSVNKKNTGSFERPRAFLSWIQRALWRRRQN